MKSAVFLDRDGTLIHDVGYLRRVDEVRWFTSTIDAVRLLNRAGFLVIVTTNQSGIGRGQYTEADLAEIHRVMHGVFEAEGARVDAWFYCPHHPEAEVVAYRAVCDCRKPAPGMIRQAEQRFAIDLSRSFVVGDKRLDMGLAETVGARGVLVRTGHGARTLETHNGVVPGAAFVAHDLMQAVSWILRQGSKEKTA